jgi:quinol monooxygenase YgiN
MGSPVPQKLAGTRDKQSVRLCRGLGRGFSWQCTFQKALSVYLPKLVFQRKRGEFEMPKIEANKGVITQVNVFSVSPENQQPLIDLLIEAANSVRDVPGWMSASIHRSLDGQSVVNYAQCENQAAWEAVMAKLRREGYLDRNKKLGAAHPCLCEVVHTLEA